MYIFSLLTKFRLSKWTVHSLHICTNDEQSNELQKVNFFFFN